MRWDLSKIAARSGLSSTLLPAGTFGGDMKALNLNPAPLAWEDKFDGLKQGLIDGAETWASAVANANMPPVVSRSVDLKFFCGTVHTALSTSAFASLGGILARQFYRSFPVKDQYLERWIA